ncbi:hypothetical protein CO230_01510 [Chryseobacterium sp. 6424]|uniref:glycosyltransferase family 4 protein n=1 Tax=Chryseobacterium sp. 6424 TaxID=2039166 RepID=UPI000EFBE8C7|nr:glycosyltransferase family 4 protein [Chryseobacterium sp. 6424]AYO56921.1 hypothetical protein CO230_01510 [Chryseobacterium sp. 6424]
MKILYVIESLGNGGAERVLLNILVVLQREGHECHVATLFDDDLLLKEFTENNITVHELKIGNRWNIVAALSGLRNLQHQYKFDILHAHLFFAHLYTGLLKRLFLPRLKTVVTFHNMGYDADPPDNLYRKIRLKLDSYIINNCFNRKIAVSNAVKLHFKKFLKSKDIKIIYNAFPIKNMFAMTSGLADSPEIFKKYRFNIVIPGRLVKEKGHKYIFEALPLLNKKFPDTGYFIAGDGPSRGELENEVQKFENVKLLGRLEQKILFEHLLAADLVVIPSLSEGFGMVVGEAMALGKAVVTTNVGGIPDIVDNGINGIMVNPGDAEMLAEAIADLLDNPGKIKNLEREASLKSRNFDVDNVAAELINVYENLIQK